MSTKTETLQGVGTEDLFGLPADVRAIIEEHQARPTETNVFFGVDTVRLTTPDGLTELRCAIWENAGAVAWRLMQHWASCPNTAICHGRAQP